MIFLLFCAIRKLPYGRNALDVLKLDLYTFRI